MYCSRAAHFSFFHFSFFIYLLLLFLQFFVTCTLIPDDASAENQRHWRHQHQAVVHIAQLLQRFIVQDVETEQRSRTQKLAEEGYDYQNLGISQTITTPSRKDSQGPFCMANASKRPMRIQFVMIRPTYTESCTLTS